MADCWHPQASWSGLMQSNQSCWPSASATFRNLVHAFPRTRHASRISKLQSAGTAPAPAGRRRTTTANTANTPTNTTNTPSNTPMHASSDMQNPTPPNYDPSLESAAMMASSIRRGRRSRPMSWHPANSTPQYVPQPSTASTTASMNLSALALPPSLNDPSLYSGHSNIPTTSYHMPGLPISEGFPSLSGLQDPLSFLPLDDSQINSTAWDSNNIKPPDYFSTTSQPLSDNWAFDMMAMNNNMPSMDAGDATGSTYDSIPSSGGVTGPSTPDLFPIHPTQDQSEIESLDSTNDDVELVGMGLYSQPESSQTSNQGVLGKGLKLEETFTPSTDKEDKDTGDDDESNDSQTGQSPTSRQEPQFFEPIKQATKPMDLLSQSFLFDDDSIDQHAIDAQLFNLSQPYTSYGYGWIWAD